MKLKRKMINFNQLCKQYYKLSMIETNYILGQSSTANVDQSKPKQVKLDNYTICPQILLGTGSFSTVYLCKSDDGSKAAVKILKKHSNKKQQHIIKVAKAEAKILRKLKHPNIVGYLGSYQSQNNYYILFDYCEGKTLRQLLNQFKTIDVTSVINIAASLIDALCYLHSKKTMHRDIKPDNVKYFKGKATLIDFGFACQLANCDKTMIKQSVGTPSYMSLEMLQKKSYNFKSDIWSLGILLYEITYGKLPWQGRSQSELCNIITNNKLTFPATPKIPQQLKSVIQGCLQKKPADRISIKNLSQFKSVPGNVTFEGENKKDVSCLFCWFL